MKTEHSTPADKGAELPTDAAGALLDAGKDAAGAEAEGATSAKEPDVKPRRKDEDRRGSGRRKERRRGDSRDRTERGGQHHQVIYRIGDC